ncbi:MAG: flagellin FliC [Planctomycetes bacterium]|jgi:flagellin|nr:flagellin FliC [Planctomycetota bacterium]
MGLRINTNVASLNAQSNLFNVTSKLSGNYSRLSSGLRIASAADDAAGLGISERMRSQIRSYGVAARNTQDGLSMAQTAEGALGEVSNILGRMRELAMQSSNGTLSANDRTTLGAEYDELVAEITRIADETEFNGVQLLDGSVTAGVDIQVGVDNGEVITLDMEDISGLTVAAGNVATQAGATAALATIDADIETVNLARGSLGAGQNRLSSTLRSILNTRENLSAAESRIRDVDVAAETADLTKNSIMQQAATSVLAQANAQPQLALSLLG